MLVLGLLILAAAVVAGVELVLANRENIGFRMWDWHWTFSAYWLAVIGAAVLLAAVIAFALMRASWARQRRIRRERAMLAAQNRELAERVGTDPVVAERPADGVPANASRGAYPAAPQAGYPAAPQAPYPADPAYGTPTGTSVPETTSAQPAAEPSHAGFFSRHAHSGRRNH